MAKREKPTYIALIGDIVSSRRVLKRAALQTKLLTVLTKVNREFAPSIASKFVVTIGDEFQGLLHEANRMNQLLGYLWAALHPIEVRFGIGVGPLDTPLLKEAIGMDGTCFHNARAALTRATEAGSLVEVEAGKDVPLFRVFGTLYSALRQRWTERQRQVFNLNLSGLSGKQIAQQLSVKPSAVSQHLRAAAAKAVGTAAELWLEALNKTLREGVDEKT